MKITLQATQLVITPAIRETAEEKFGRLRRLLTRFDHTDLLLHVELGRITHRHHKGKIFRAEGRITLGRKELYSAIESEELYTAMDHCISALKKQIVGLKERANS